MLIYPQLSAALIQFPVVKRRRMRTIVNAMADGGAVKLSDPGGQTTEWELKYAELSDGELAALQQFFAATEGSLNGFTFLDPAGNLLAWSEDLTNAIWNKGPLLQVHGGTLTNTGGGPQSLDQTLNSPGAYLYCFSLSARAAGGTGITLTIGSNRFQRSVTADWSLLSATAQGDAGAGSIVFGIEIPGGVTVEVQGAQVEPQASPSRYQISTTGGVYEGARFRDDEFSFISKGPNRHSATVNIVYANHL